jgi:hypothetical protein
MGGAAVTRMLAFDLVEIVAAETPKMPGEKREWVNVKLADGQTGFVAAEFIRGPVDYRAIFEKQNGRWVMTAFVAGD